MAIFAIFNFEALVCLRSLQMAPLCKDINTMSGADIAVHVVVL